MLHKKKDFIKKIANHKLCQATNHKEGTPSDFTNCQNEYSINEIPDKNQKSELHKQSYIEYEKAYVDTSNDSIPLNSILLYNPELNEAYYVAKVVSIIREPSIYEPGSCSDHFWEDLASSLLNGVIMHLLYYKQHRQHLPIMFPRDIFVVLSYLNRNDTRLRWEDFYDSMDFITDIMTFPHITPEEFMNKNTYKNPLREKYGLYVKDMSKFNEALCLSGLGYPRDIDDVDELQTVIKQAINEGIAIDWTTRNDEAIPYHRLLTHPVVAECMSSFICKQEFTRTAIVQTGSV